MLDKPGGIFVRRLEQIPNDDRVLLQSAARIVLDRRARLAPGTTRTPQRARAARPRINASRAAPGRDAFAAAATRDLIFHNGLGGFTPRWPRIRHHAFTRPGHARAVGQCAGQSIIRHRRFRKRQRLYLGRERHEFRLTPGTTIRSRDLTGEAFYIRDEETGQFLVAHSVAGPRRQRLTSFGMVLVIPFSSTPRTASFPSCGFMSRWTRR